MIILLFLCHECIKGANILTIFGSVHIATDSSAIIGDKCAVPFRA